MNITIDASKVTGVIAGSAMLEDNVYDTWFYKNVEFQGGKIYGLVSEYGQGCMYLSYLLGGREDFGDLIVSIDDKKVTAKNLSDIGWNLEPSKETYKNKTVKKSIEKALLQGAIDENFATIAEKFWLTEERFDCKLHCLSGERWRASAALGYASGKKIFFAPYMNSRFYYQMNHSHLFDALRYLADKGAIVVLPVGSDSVMKNFADECIYLDPVYEI